MPRVTQLSRITMMLILSNHVLTGLRSRSRDEDTGWMDGGREGGRDKPGALTGGAPAAYKLGEPPLCR